MIEDRIKELTEQIKKGEELEKITRKVNIENRKLLNRLKNEARNINIIAEINEALEIKPDWEKISKDDRYSIYKKIGYRLGLTPWTVERIYYSNQGGLKNA